MFRAKWTAILVAALCSAGLVLAQKPPSEGCPRVVTIQEGGKPPMQCRVLKTWAEGNGAAFEVEVLATGERITLVESGPIMRHNGGGKVVQEVRSRIYHWAHNVPPPGTPMAPPDAVVPGMPAGVQLAQPTDRHSPYPVVPAVVAPAPAAVATAEPTPAAVTPAVAASPLATVTPVDRTPAMVVKPVPPGAAQESDWRQSWGKADDHKSSAPAVAPPPSQMPAKVQLPQASREGPDPLADVEPFSPYHLKQQDVNMPTIQVTPGEGVAKAAKPPSEDDDPLKLDDPKKEDVATGNKTEPEHKDEPKKAEVASKPAEKSVEKPVEKKEAAAPAPAKGPSKKPEAVTLSSRFKAFLARKDKPKSAAPASAEEQAAQETGMRSIYAACEAAGMPMPAPGMPPSLPAPPALVDTDPSNAFTTVVKEPAHSKSVPSEQANAFDGTRPTPPMQPYQMPQGMPPMPPRGYAGMPPMPPGVMPAYGQAPPPPGVMLAGYPRPGMVPAGYPNPNMMPAGYVNPNMMPARAPMMAPPAGPPVADAQQLLLVLRSSLFPSNREWAAEQLGATGGNPVVVEMLLQSAKNDPAPTVREACVRNLGKMNANTPNVVEALTALQKDENDSVRNEVTRTLSKLQTASQPGSFRSPIQPASMR